MEPPSTSIWIIACFLSISVTCLLLLFPLKLFFPFNKAFKSASKSIPSPLRTLIPHLSSTEISSLAYPPNLLPNPRNISTPFGTTRLYSWGPAHGRKVLFIHGDATPCPIFARIAQGLVEKGCRAMLYDTWGRGYTDAPVGQPLTSSFFVAQIVFVLASCSLFETSGERISLIGFSLGGCIALDFASTYPEKVESLVLLGPAGLMRSLPLGYDGLVLGSTLFDPHGTIVRRAVARLLGVEYTDAPPLPQGKKVDSGNSALSRENDEREDHWRDQELDMSGLLQFQFTHHAGHAAAFHETIQHGPLMSQQAIWAKACNIIAGRTCPESGLYDSKLLIFFGDEDDVVVGRETEEDIASMLPKNKLEIEYLPGGHGFVWENSGRITKRIEESWGM